MNLGEKLSKTKRRIILALSFLKKDHPRMILPGKRRGKDDPSPLYHSTINKVKLVTLISLSAIGLFLAGLIIYLQITGRALRRFGYVEIGDKRYTAVYAISPAERQQGLSGRKSIGADGMVFINPRLETSVFWMNKMEIPLDFVWIADGVVVDLHEQVPTPADAGSIVRVRPIQPVDTVIELYSGTISRDNITIGTPVNRVLNWYFSLW